MLDHNENHLQLRSFSLGMPLKSEPKWSLVSSDLKTLRHLSPDYMINQTSVIV